MSRPPAKQVSQQRYGRQFAGFGGEYRCTRAARIFDALRVTRDSAMAFARQKTSFCSSESAMFGVPYACGAGPGLESQHNGLSN